MSRDITERRGWDSNPRDALRRLTAFKAAAFNRSATPPGRSDDMSMLTVDLWTKRHEVESPRGDWIQDVRRLHIFASTMVFFDVAFYAAIAPLLPDYVADLDLSKAEAGILAASYAAGTLLASLPGGLVATWAGPRRTVIGGLLLLGCSSLVFGLAGNIVLLDLARFA